MQSSSSSGEAGAPVDPRDAYFDVSAVRANLTRSTSNGALATLAASGLKLVMQFGSLAVIGRLLPPDEYGIYALATPLVMITIALSNFGLVQALTQREHVTHRLATTFFWVNLGLGVFFSLMLTLLGPLAGWFYSEPRVAPVFAAMALAVLFSAISSQYIGLLRRQLKIGLIERTDVTSGLLGIFVAIGALLLGFSYWAIVLQQVIGGAARLVMLMVRTGWTPSGLRACNFHEAKSALSFGGQVAGINLLNRFSNSLGAVIAGYSLNPAMAGLFTRAQNLSEMPLTRFLSPLSSTTTSALSRVQDQPQEFRDLFSRLVNRTGMILLPMGVGITLAAHPLILLLLGEGWAGSAPLLAWLGLRILYGPGERGCWWALVSAGRTRSLRIYGFGLVILRIAALIIGVQFGLSAMAAALTIAEFGPGFVLISWLALRDTHLDLKTLASAYLIPLAIAFVVLGLGYVLLPLLPEMSAFSEFLVTGVYIGVAFGGLTLLNPSQRGDVFRLFHRLREMAPAPLRPRAK